METRRTQQRAAAEHQSLYRNVNERIEELNEFLASHGDEGTWMCECACPGCDAQVPMTLDAYEALRGRSNRFVVFPGDEHVVPAVERVVERTDAYWIVEKLGAAAERAAELD